MSHLSNGPWDVLGISSSAHLGDIKRAYGNNKVTHANNPQKLVEIEAAYTTVLGGIKPKQLVKPMQKGIATTPFINRSKIHETAIAAAEAANPMSARAFFNAPPVKQKPKPAKIKFITSIVAGVEGLINTEEVITNLDNPLFNNPVFERFFKDREYDGGSYRIPGQDICDTITITLDEAYKGIQKHVTYQMIYPCGSCARTCDKCNGGGRMTMYKIISGMKQKQQVMCPACHTRGYTIILACKTCSFCEGKGYRNENRTMIWNLHPGIRSDITTILEGMGEQIVENRCPPGNRVLTLDVVMPTPRYSRVGDHLKVKLPISFIQTLCGARYGVRFPSGEVVILDTKQDIKHIIHPLIMHRYKEKGMPIWDTNEGKIIGYGDAIIHFEIDYGKIRENITSENIEVFKDAYNQLIEQPIDPVVEVVANTTTLTTTDTTTLTTTDTTTLTKECTLKNSETT
jgi:DnaJ-class molecular chaperone